MKKKHVSQLLVIFLFAVLSYSYISCETSIDVSEEMKSFMSSIDSTNSMDDSAETYGYSNDDIPLGYYEVKEPTVTGSTVEGAKTCYDVNVKHGLVDSNIVVCWEDGKIVSITEIE